MARGQAREQGSASPSCIRERTGVAVDPDSLFDIQVKRIHEYKRQHLNVLHIVTLYHRLKREPAASTCAPRTFIFGGKAAPGYRMAKLHHQAHQRRGRGGERRPGRARTAARSSSSPTSTCKNAQPIYPAADLSEQISTAGKEASGTGNMKFALNGALTIGTLDGANVEIREEVGRRELLPVRPDRRRGRPRQARGLPARATYVERNAELRDGARPDRRRRASRAATASCSGRWSTTCSATIQFLVLADYAGVRRLPGARERGVARPGALDAHVDPEHGARREVLVRPRDPRVLRGRSGTCRRCR